MEFHNKIYNIFFFSKFHKRPLQKDSNDRWVLYIIAQNTTLGEAKHYSTCIFFNCRCWLLALWAMKACWHLEVNQTSGMVYYVTFNLWVKDIVELKSTCLDNMKNLAWSFVRKWLIVRLEQRRHVWGCQLTPSNQIV